MLAEFIFSNFGGLTERKDNSIIKIVMKKRLFVFLLLIGLFILPSVVAAALGPQEPSQPAATEGNGVTVLQNPLTTDDPREIVGLVIRAVLGIVGSLALLMFIYGGFLWVTSAGNDEKVKKGKDIIVWASIGLAVIFFSYIMVTFVIGALTGSSGAETTGTGG